MTATTVGFSHFVAQTSEIGFVRTNNHPIIQITGLPSARLNELVVFENESLGVVTGISEELIQVASFSKNSLPIGAKVVSTNMPMRVPVGYSLLGKTIDVFGESLMPGEIIQNLDDTVEVNLAPIIMSERQKISQPFYTGVSVVDVLLPLGKGQRELIIGDKQTGKTSFLLQVCAFQAKIGSIIVYCCIGKSKSDINKINNFISSNNMKERVILLVSESSDPLISTINVPYTAMGICEWFCHKGEDVTLILDDLTTHAKYYRELSLLSNKFPGRSSYPGDIFHLHAKLLERAGNFRISTSNKTEASITCLPVVDTVENDVSGYIQTNIMSITDGHLFFDKEIFLEGRRPSINYFLSVTRVGRQTQNPLRWAVNREIVSFLSLYEKVQSFVQFGAELNEGTQSTLRMGQRIEASFNQDIEDTMPISLQLMLLTLIWLGIWNNEDIASIKVTTKKMLQLYQNDSSYAGLIDSIVYNATSMNQLLFNVNQNLQNITKYV